jgi:hypothetical protein
MNKPDPFGEQKLKQLELFIYLLPIVGSIPALWRLYSKQGSREQQIVSRFSVTLTLIWLITYSLLWAGAAQTSELTTLRILYFNGLFTSGYFLVCIGLMVRLWQGKLPRLGSISRVAEKIVGRH